MCHLLVAAIESHACHSEETDPRGDAEDGQHLPLVGVTALCRGRREKSWGLPEIRHRGPGGGNYIVYWLGRLTHVHVHARTWSRAPTISNSIKQPMLLSVSVSAGAGDRFRQSSVTCAKWSVIIILFRRSRQETPKDSEHSRVQHGVCVCAGAYVSACLGRQRSVTDGGWELAANECSRSFLSGSCTSSGKGPETSGGWSQRMSVCLNGQPSSWINRDAFAMRVASSTSWHMS